LSSFSYHGRWAAASYCKIQVGKWDCGDACGGASVGTIPTLVFNRHAAIGFVAYHEQQERIIVSFRGTYSPRQALTDLKMHMTPFPPASTQRGKVHSGFFVNYELVREEILNEVTALRRRFPHFRIIVTGHSLGGALAALMATALYEHDPTSVIYTFSYGAPRLGNPGLAKYIDSLPIHLVNMVYGYDFAPHTPTLGLEYVHAGRELWVHNGT
ncbi:MAG: Alpha/Beta hydrolase protein, partial [Piptocephalis tieghemiana]